MPACGEPAGLAYRGWILARVREGLRDGPVNNLCARRAPGNRNNDVFDAGQPIIDGEMLCETLANLTMLGAPVDEARTVIETNQRNLVRGRCLSHRRAK